MILFSQIAAFFSILITTIFLFVVIVGVIVVMTSEIISLLKLLYKHIKSKFFKKDRH